MSRPGAHRPRAVNLSTTSDIDDVSKLASAVRALCADRFAPEELDAIELSLVEAINNVIEHGYDGQRDKPLQVVVDQQEDHIVLEIIDEAPPMPGGLFASASNIEFDESAIHDLPEGGFGLALIKMNMDEVEYSSSNGRNHLRMVKYRGKLLRPD